jgi:para-aminobenzoate synthetase component 1
VSIPHAWFAGTLATGLLDLSDDVAALDEGGWWAVVATFEGDLTLARFADVRPAPAPAAGREWAALRGPWASSLDRGGYLAAVREVRARVARGEVYQANVCRVLEHALDDDADLGALAALVRLGNPAPHAGRVLVPGADIVCASPELLLRRDGDVVTTGPVKGTAPTADALLRKDFDENVMIVDLARNDLSQVCRPGSVEVVDLLRPEPHPGLVHLVSRVRGRLLPDVGWPRLWAALMPPASVSGAPKSAALQAIHDLEPVPRGPYCGAVGWVDADTRTAELAVGIRTFWAVPGAGRRVLRFGTGAGITWGSEPQGEWDETELKAARLVGLAEGSDPAAAPEAGAPLVSLPH